MIAKPRLGVTGHYAGPVSRTAATVADVAIIFGLFTMGTAGLSLLSNLFLDWNIEGSNGWVWGVSLLVWAFIYAFGGLAIAGRTPGKTLVGLRVVGKDGSVLSVGRALGRTLVFPINIITFGLGFLGVIFQREHRALSDMIAKTAVVYDWGSRTAELPGPLSAFIAREAGEKYSRKT